MRCMSGPLPPLLAPFPSNPMQQPPKRPPSTPQSQSPTSCVSYLCNSSHSLTFCAWVCHEYMRGIYLGVYYIRDYLRPRVCACVYTCIYRQQIKDCMCPTMQTQTDSQTLHLSRVAKWIDKYIHTKRTQSQGSSKHTHTHIQAQPNAHSHLDRMQRQRLWRQSAPTKCEKLGQSWTDEPRTDISATRREQLHDVGKGVNGGGVGSVGPEGPKKAGVRVQRAVKLAAKSGKTKWMLLLVQAMWTVGEH